MMCTCRARIGWPALLLWDAVIKKGMWVSLMWQGKKCQSTEAAINVALRSSQLERSSFEARHRLGFAQRIYELIKDSQTQLARWSSHQSGLIYITMARRLWQTVTCPSQQLFMFPRPRSQKSPGSRVLTLCLFRACTSVEFHSVHLTGSAKHDWTSSFENEPSTCFECERCKIFPWACQVGKLAAADGINSREAQSYDLREGIVN